MPVTIPRLKNTVLPTIYQYLEGNRWIHAFSKCINAKWNAVFSRTWTQIANFISCKDNRFTKRALASFEFSLDKI